MTELSLGASSLDLIFSGLVFPGLVSRRYPATAPSTDLSMPPQIRASMCLM
jgi:hypothetical protein